MLISGNKALSPSRQLLKSLAWETENRIEQTTHYIYYQNSMFSDRLFLLDPKKCKKRIYRTAILVFKQTSKQKVGF